MKDNTNMQPPVPTGNDMSYGDATQEERMDKDEDLKQGDDDTSPLAKPFEERRDLTPGAPAAEDGMDIHTDGNKAEEDEPDPTSQDAPELRENS